MKRRVENPRLSPVSLSSLLCQETETRFYGDEVGEDEEGERDKEDPILNFTNNVTLDDEYIQILLETESDSGNNPRPSEGCARNARLGAIEYVVNTRALFGFCFKTVYLSVSYFDQFLSKRGTDSERTWEIQLLSVACLSLAAKLEECQVPVLSELQGGEFNFENRIIQRMELLVLNTLEWKMGSVTPFVFLPCLINKFCNDSSPPEGIVSRAVELILAIMRAIRSQCMSCTFFWSPTRAAQASSDLLHELHEFQIFCTSYTSSKDHRGSSLLNLGHTNTDIL